VKPTAYRDVMIRAKGVCECCLKPSHRLEIHHLIARSKTPKGPIRDLTEVPELMLVICPVCHAQVHAYPNTKRPKLFQALYRIWGYEAVKAAFDAVKATGIYLGFELPEAENRER
jgi:5-methylcytosine-specific restriction endonuclease McrA